MTYGVLEACVEKEIYGIKKGSDEIKSDPSIFIVLYVDDEILLFLHPAAAYRNADQPKSQQSEDARFGYIFPPADILGDQITHMRSVNVRINPADL